MAMVASIARLASRIACEEKRMATIYSGYEAAYDLSLHMNMNNLTIGFQNSAGYMDLNTKP